MDLFKDLPPSLTAPATDATSLTPSDTAVLSPIPRAIFIGQAGDVTVEMQGGQVVTYSNVQGGTVLAIRALRVHQTGTTASAIVSMW